MSVRGGVVLRQKVFSWEAEEKFFFESELEIPEEAGRVSLHTPRAGSPDEVPGASASASTGRVSDESVLAGSSALIVGVGGLGSPAALALAAAGVARIALADHDTVTLDNLARQILHRTEDLGRLKVDSGADSIFRLCPEGGGG